MQFCWRKRQHINILPAFFSFTYIITTLLKIFHLFYFQYVIPILLGCSNTLKPRVKKVGLRKLVLTEQKISFSSCNCSRTLTFYSFHIVEKWRIYSHLPNIFLLPVRRFGPKYLVYQLEYFNHEGKKLCKCLSTNIAIVASEQIIVFHIK